MRRSVYVSMAMMCLLLAISLFPGTPVHANEPADESLTEVLLPGLFNRSLFRAYPARGTPPLTVSFQWALNTIRNCGLYVVSPGAESAKPVAFKPCYEDVDSLHGQLQSYEYTFEKPGEYTVALVPLSDAELTAYRRDYAAFRTAFMQRSVAVNELTKHGRTKLIVVDPPPEPEPVWVRRPPETNPYDLSVEGELQLGNTLYAGSAHECAVKEDSIEYRYYVLKQQDVIANLLFIHDFDAPPELVLPGETITLTHAIEVHGELTPGNGFAISGRGDLNSTVNSNYPLVTVNAASLNLPALPTRDEDIVHFTFPTTGNIYGLEARILESGLPDIGCDVVWWYDLEMRIGP